MFKFKRRKPHLIAQFRKELNWNDGTNEAIHIFFYSDDDGNRSAAWEYYGEYARRVRYMSNFMHIVRKWEDANILPNGSEIIHTELKQTIDKLTEK